MAEETAKKRRKLRPAPLTMRERAERESKKSGKPGKRHLLRRAAGGFARLPIWKPFRGLRHLPIWKPFKVVGMIIVPPYLRNSWKELRLVEWPNGKQTRQLTMAVVLFAIVFGVIVAAFDYGLDKLFKQVIIK